MKRYLYKKLFEDELTYWWTRGRHQMVFDWLKWFDQVSDKQSLLDVGCGAGGFLTKAKTRSFRIAGIDCSKDAIDFSLKRGLTDVILGDITALPYKSKSFDVVTALDVIEHVENDKGALREMFRVLRPGGLVYIAVPALTALWSERDIRLEHVRRYGRRQLIRVVEDAGFQVLKTSFANLFFLPALFWVAKAKNSQGLFSVKTDVAKTNLFLNQIFYFFLRAESYTTRLFSLPIGTSLVVLARKPKGSRILKK